MCRKFVRSIFWSLCFDICPIALFDLDAGSVLVLSSVSGRGAGDEGGDAGRGEDVEHGVVGQFVGGRVAFEETHPASLVQPAGHSDSRGGSAPSSR